jgi:hypothetical protein
MTARLPASMKKAGAVESIREYFTEATTSIATASVAFSKVGALWGSGGVVGVVNGGGGDSGAVVTRSERQLV